MKSPCFQRGNVNREGWFARFLPAGGPSRTLAALFAASCLAGMAVQAPAQSVFNSLGQDAALIPALAGDQVHPDLAVSPSGGFVVWQDSLGDGDGFGIRAQALDAQLLPGFSAFSVNEQVAGDQELPRVELFPDGGAIFIWQSRVDDDRNVQARFMAPDGAFRGAEIRVNHFTTDDQQDADIAILKNGNAVVVWSSMGQDGSMQGVFAQIFSPEGVRIGGVFQANQTTQYNQQTPAVAALASGGFVITWISEDLPLVKSIAGVADANFGDGVENRIHVFARLFGAGGAGMGGEFRVSQSAAVASNPVAAGLDNGGFSIAWTERHVSDASLSYDVFLRRFNEAAAPLGNEFRVNGHNAAPQYDVSLETLGNDHLATWTSFGQDGSAEGVYGRFIGVDGGFLSADTQINTAHTASAQMHAAVAADGIGRMLAVWTSFNAGSSFDIFVKRFDAVRELPTPSAPFVNALDSASLAVTWPALHGYPGVEYRVYLDGAQTPAIVTASNRGVVDNLTSDSAHSFRLQYRLADGRVSTLSAAAAGRTWGADGNQDGIPDNWQAAHWGASPAAWPTDAKADSDGDGASDLQEFLAGTDPTDPASALKSGLQMNGGQIQLNWNARAGQSYIIETSTDLISWTAVGQQFANDGTASINLNNFNAAAFYRVVLQR